MSNFNTTAPTEGFAVQQPDGSLLTPNSSMLYGTAGAARREAREGDAVMAVSITYTKVRKPRGAVA